MTLDDAYQPDSDIDARSAAHQILGDAFDDVYGGDWAQALKNASATWAPAPTQQPVQAAA